MTCFEENVLDTINKYNMLTCGDRVVVGLSGGADSCALLYALNSLKSTLGISLYAAHLNHEVRGDEALRDMNFSEELAIRYDVPFISKAVNVPEYAKENKISVEAAGRILRYEFFEEVCVQYNCNKIAVAHNKNDRAETILLNIIRGSAAKGFEGIKAVNDNIIRPLIETSRSDIEDYASYNSIDYVTDSTNLEDIYARNIVRNNILTQMSKINSNAIGNIIRCSEILSTESEYIDSVVQRENLIKTEANKVVIDKKRLLQLHVSVRRRTIVYALTKLCGNVQNVSSRQIDSLAGNIKTGKIYKFGNGAYASITSDYVVLSKLLATVPDYTYKVNIPGFAEIKETGAVYKFEFVSKYKKKINSICISLDGVDEDTIILRTRKDGDVFKPFGMTGYKKIKSFFIDNKIPSFERNLFPLLVSGENILAVLPLRTSEDCRVKEDTKKILMITKLGGTYDKE